MLERTKRFLFNRSLLPIRAEQRAMDYGYNISRIGYRLVTSISSRNVKETIVKMKFDMGIKRKVGAEIIDYRKDTP